MKPQVLIVDDEPDIRRLVKEILEDEGYSVAVAKDGASALQAIEVRTPSLVLLDIWMPDVDGITLLKEFVNVHHLNCPVIMMSGHGTVEAAVEATRLGAFDFIEKPLSLSKLLLTVEHALANTQAKTGQHLTHHAILESVEIVGKSPAMKKLMENLERCASHDITVLIYGEVGSGRTRCAHYIHANSKRKQAPYVEFRTPSLCARHEHKDSDAELVLGREQPHKPGCLEQANGGTLYINDVAELNSDMQAALYAALSSGSIYRLDGDDRVDLDMRVIAATRYDLLQEVRAKRFREDLYYALNEFPLHVPPLREHCEDVTELLQYYVRTFSDKEGLSYRNFSVAAQNRLRNYIWPGNILELENLVRRLLIQGGSVNIEVADVEAVLEETKGSVTPEAPSLVLPEFDLPLRQAREQFEKAYLEFHLKQSEGSVGKVAKLAGMERTHLYRKLRSLGIETK